MVVRFLVNPFIAFSIMRYLPYLLSALMLTGWALGLYSFHPGKQIHFLLVLGLMNIMVNIRDGEYRLNK